MRAGPLTDRSYLSDKENLDTAQKKLAQLQKELGKTKQQLKRAKQGKVYFPFDYVQLKPLLAPTAAEDDDGDIESEEKEDSDSGGVGFHSSVRATFSFIAGTL